MESADSDLFAQRLPDDVVASAFANHELYLVLANYAPTGVKVETVDASTRDPCSSSGRRYRSRTIHADCVDPHRLRIFLLLARGLTLGERRVGVGQVARFHGANAL